VALAVAVALAVGVAGVVHANVGQKLLICYPLRVSPVTDKKFQTQDLSHKLLQTQ
jgi:hypothetical protein